MKDVTADSEDILLVGDTFTTVYNDAFKDRQQIVLKFMLEQGQDQSAGMKKLLRKTSKHLSGRRKTNRQSLRILQIALSRRSAQRPYRRIQSQLENTVEDLINSGIYIYSTLDGGNAADHESRVQQSSNYPSIRVCEPQHFNGNMIDKTETSSCTKNPLISTVTTVSH